jgi:hypothetical protein
MTMNRTLPALALLAVLLAATGSAAPQDPQDPSAAPTDPGLPATAVQEPKPIDAEVGGLSGDPLSPGVSTMSVNDPFASAVTISAYAFYTTGNNALDTTQSGEPLTCDGATMGHTVWYKVVPAVTGVLYADTYGASFDTVLALYEGTSLASLSQRACNDDYYGLQSRIETTVFVGTTYYLQLGGYGSASGNFALYVDNYSPCSNNDNQANACYAYPGYTDAKSTAGMTTELGELPAINCPATTINVGHTAWYRYTVPIGTGTPTLTANTAGSSYDTVLDVFEAQGGHSLVPVACNDDFGGLQSQVAWTGLPGSTYYIRVSGYGTAYGNMAFSLS